MSVPAWPMPIQKTKFVMSKAHATGMFEPQTPTPVEIRYVAARTPPVSSDEEIEERRPPPVRLRFLGDLGDLLATANRRSAGPHTSGMRGSGSGNRGRSVRRPGNPCVSWAFVMHSPRQLNTDAADSEAPRIQTADRSNPVSSRSSSAWNRRRPRNASSLRPSGFGFRTRGR